MTYVDEKRERVSAETAYLTPDVLARPNLRVAIHAHVTRILFETVDGATRATGVEFARGEKMMRYRARARREVIVWCVSQQWSLVVDALLMLQQRRRSALSTRKCSFSVPAC